jgi:uncharacterized protein YvpB
MTSEVRLEVPYLSQLNNVCSPYSTCNTTSVAMCLAFFGHRQIDEMGLQLEDELTDYCYANALDNHSPFALQELIKRYGYEDNFQIDAQWKDVKAWIGKGKPCIVHGFFTKSGHIIVIVGYSDEGFIVHDPYGEWFRDGYSTNCSGENLTYSYGMMKETCGPDGDLWIHYVSDK